MASRNVFSTLFAVLLGTAGLMASGCESSPNAQALFTRPELYNYERHAVLGLNPEQEQLFMAAYIKTFSGRLITFVERSRLREIISEQDLLQGRLNERTRAKIKRILGVEALIMCEYYDGQDANQKKLRVRIVDSETGAIVGSVLIEAPGDFAGHAQAAAEAIKTDLLGGSRSEPLLTRPPADEGT